MSDLTPDAVRAELTKRARRSKRKGAAGERDVVEMAVAAGFPDCRRNFGSGASGGNDLVNVGELAIECKRTERLALHKAYEQCCTAARPTETPVVAHKRNRGPWLVTLDLRTFLELYKQATTGEESVRGP